MKLAVSLAVLLLGVCVAAVAHRALAALPHFYDHEATNNDESRMQALARALPEIREQPLALVMGASTLVRLDTRLVDQHLRELGVELHTYNLAMDDANVDVQSALTRRLAALHTHARVIILDVSLALLTERGRSTFDAEPFFFVAIEDAPGLRELFRRRPLDALDVGFRKYVMGDQYYGDVANFAGRGLDHAWPCRLTPDPGSSPQDAQRLLDYCALERARGGYEMGWHLATQGNDPVAPPELMSPFEHAEGFDVVDPEARRTHTLQHLYQLVRKDDLLDVHFDEASVAALTEVAKTLSTLSQHVVLLLSPENPLVVRTPEAEARISALKTRLRTVATVVDLRHSPLVEPNDFLDAIHVTFARGSADHFATAVANGIAGTLSSR